MEKKPQLSTIIPKPPILEEVRIQKPLDPMLTKRLEDTKINEKVKHIMIRSLMMNFLHLNFVYFEQNK